METARARAIAERLHRGHRQEDGALLLDHVRRVALATCPEARSVAWLHEALAVVAVTEHELLMAGLTDDELRALRLLSPGSDSRSEAAYFGHLELIACAAGLSGRLARLVKTADLHDRCLHPHVRRDGWSPSYRRALEWMEQFSAKADHDADSPASCTAMVRRAEERGWVHALRSPTGRAHAGI